MANEKIFQSRIQLKHDVEENWLKATNFIPKEGEIIIYDVDANNPTPRFKIGNGETVVNLLPFAAAQADWNITDENDSGYIKNKPDYDKIVTDVEELSTQLNEVITNKADKSELFSGSWNDLEDKPFGYKDDYVTILEEQTYTNNSSISYLYFQGPGSYSVIIDQKDTYIITKTGGVSSFGDSTYQEYPFFMQFSAGRYYLTFKDGQSHSVEFKLLQTTPFPIDEVFIPETFAKVDYVDTQINTHTHDFETLTNKPFYENVTLTLLSQGTQRGASTANLQASLTEGEYSVKFNGVEYIIFIDENTTEISSENLPFIISKFGNESIGITWLIKPVDTTIEQYSYEISLIERDLKQLDKKFIPNEIVNKVENCLTNEDILIITLADEDLFINGGWKDLVKEASAKGQYILINYNNVYYNVKVTDDGYCKGYAPISDTEISQFNYNLNQNSGSQIVTFASPLEVRENKISNWSDKKSGSTTHYPSIKAMEEYVDGIKNDLLNGAGDAYDTLKELGELIDDNTDAIDALEILASKQSDWNQNDETALDHVKNRTHWVEKEINILAGPFRNGCMISQRGSWPDIQEHLEVGKSYVVICEGVKYDVICYEYTDGWFATYRCLGDSRKNLSYPSKDENGEFIYGSDNLPITTVDERYPSDVPFFIEYRLEDDGGSGMTWIHTYYVTSEFEVSVGNYTDNFIYHPLDENYIPETIARASDVNDAINAISITALTEAEIDEICNTTIQYAEGVMF